MRTDGSSPPSPAPGRLRARIERAWRWARQRGPAARWTFALAALGALLLAGYYYANPVEPGGSVWLYDGRKFPKADASKIVEALAAGEIPAVEEQGRVGVSADLKAKALAILAKSKLGPQSIDEIQREAAAGSPWDSPYDRELKQRRAREQILRAMIGRQHGVLSAEVVLSPSRPSAGPRSTRMVRATISVQTEGDRALGTQTIQTIRDILTSIEPDLEPDGVTLIDGKGRPYLVPGHAEVNVHSLAQAREEELEEKIREQLDRIEGVRVSVNLDAATAPTPARPAPPAPQVVPNRPISEPPANAEEPVAPTGAKALGKFKVLVEVPNSYYLNCFRALIPDRKPSPDDLQPLVEKTEASIREAVENVVPTGELAKLSIIRFNTPGPVRPPAVPGEAELWRVRSWWVPAGAAAMAVTLVGAVAMGRWLAMRRPTTRPARPLRRPHFDPAGAPSASVRVRELVRLDPEAAAGVLSRWIGGGGGTTT